MKRLLVLFLFLFYVSSCFAAVHKEQYSNVACSALWDAVRDTLYNSGKFQIFSIDNANKISSYGVRGGAIAGSRLDKVILNSTDHGTGCELQIESFNAPLLSGHDADEFKKSVDESLVRLKDDPSLVEKTPQPYKAPPAHATARVLSSPAGADIEVDGVFVGNTTSNIALTPNIPLTPGTHQIVIKKKGFLDWSKTITVKDATITLNAELEPAPTK